MFKNWNTGDLVDSDNYDGSTSYSTIEGFEVSDKVNKSDLNRPLRNIHENVVHNKDFLSSWIQFNGMTNGVLKDGLTQEFEFHGDSDVFAITVKASTGDTTMYYTRMPPGIAKVDDIIVVSRPQTHIAERQLESIFHLESWNDESVQIVYYETTDRFQARITRRNINGTAVHHDFTNSGTWGDSTDGYLSGIQLLEAIYADTTYFRDEFQAAVGVDLLQIELEPTIEVSTGNTIYWYINTQGEVVGGTSAGGANDLDLCHYTITTPGSGYTSFVDERTYIQNFNDFSQHIYLNVPQEWGDTDTASITNPYKDSTVNYANITNQNSLLVFLRKSTGDTYDSSIFGWYESTIPDIDKTRSDTFFMNRDLILITDQSGDTLGSSWVSIKELSGDSWTFYGDKIFLNGYLKQNGTIAHFILDDTSSDSFKIDTAGGLDIDTDKGFAINDDNGSWITLSDGGTLSIKSNAATTINSGGGTLTLTATGTGANIVLNASGDTVKINNGSFYVESSDTIANSIKLETSGGIDIDTDNGFTLNENSGAYFYINNDGAISLVSASSQNITVDSTSATTEIKGTTFRVSSGTFDVDSPTNTFNGDSLTATMSGAISLTSDTFSATASGASFHLTTSGAIEATSANGQDITFTSDNDINFVAAGDTIHWTADTFHLNISEYNLTTGVYTIITGSGQLTLQSSQNDADAIVLDATTGGLTIDAVQDIVITSGDTVKLIGVGSYITNGENIILNTTGSMTLESHNGFSITDNDTSIISVSSAGNISLASKSGQNITVDSTSATTEIKGTTFRVSSGTFDVDSPTNTFNGDSLTAAMSGAISLNSTSTGTGISLSVTGTGGDISISANDTISIDGDDISLSASNGSIGINGSGRIDVDAATGQLVDIYSDTEVQINGGALIYLNATTMTFDGDTFDLNASLDLDTSGTVNINSTSTSTHAIQLMANNGTVDIDADDIYIDASGGSFYIDTNGDISLSPNSSTTISGTTLNLNSTNIIGGTSSIISFPSLSFSARVTSTSPTAIYLESDGGIGIISQDNFYVTGYSNISFTASGSGSISLSGTQINANNTALTNNNFSGAYFSHTNFAATLANSYAVLHDSTGNTSINAVNAKVIYFQINGTNYGILNGGKWGFGAANTSTYTVKVTGSLETTGNVSIGGTLSSGATTFTSLTASGQILGKTGTAASPSFAFSSDPDTGMYSAGANIIGFTTGSLLRFKISGDYLLPRASGTCAIGNSSTYFNASYINNMYGTIKTAAQGSITSLGTLTSLSVSGTTTLSSTLSVSGTATLSTVDINSGNIDGTAIGSSSPSSGKFTTIRSSGQIDFYGDLYLRNGKNIVLQAGSSPTYDPGDLVFNDYSGTEKGRIFIDPGGTDTMYFRITSTPYLTLTTSGISVTGNVLVSSHISASGHISAGSYIYTTSYIQSKSYIIASSYIYSSSYVRGLNGIVTYHGSSAPITTIAGTIAMKSGRAEHDDCVHYRATNTLAALVWRALEDAPGVW